MNHKHSLDDGTLTIIGAQHHKNQAWKLAPEEIRNIPVNQLGLAKENPDLGRREG